MLKLIKRKHPEATQSGDEIRFHCPYCIPKDFGKHFYYNERKHQGHCFKCETKLFQDSLLKYILGTDYGLSAVKDRLSMASDSKQLHPLPREHAKAVPGKLPMPLPEGESVNVGECVGVVGNCARAYLRCRGVDAGATRDRFLLYPDSKTLWSKIVFPITLGGEIVYWVARNFIKFGSALQTLVPDNIKGHFRKSDVVYGLDSIDIDEPMVVVEGIFDALTTPNAVALLGKTLSSEQKKLILNINPSKVIVMLDGDVDRNYVCKMACRFSLHAPTEIVLLPANKDPNDCRDFVKGLVKNSSQISDIELDFSI